MKKSTLFVAALLSASTLFSQDILIKIDAEVVTPTGGQAFPSVASANNQMVHLCVTDEVPNYYEANTGSNRTVSSSTLLGKDSEKLIRSQYLASGSSFWYIGAVNTQGFEDIHISAWHSGAVSGTNAYEPQKNWIFEYCIGNAADKAWNQEEITWNHIMDYSIDVKDWTETAVTLPAECNDQQAISFRWRSAQDQIGVNGGTSNTNGWTWIDEINITGKSTTGSSIKHNIHQHVSLTVINEALQISNFTGKATVIDLTGSLLQTKNIEMSDYITMAQKGIYLIKLESEEGNSIHKINIR